MAWLRIDDGFSQHPKVVKLSRADRWTWLEVLCYCARFRTDGKVPSVVGEVVRGASPSFLQRCSEFGLLDHSDGGYLVHDWTIYNGETIGEKVAYYLDKSPDASANEVHRAIGGKRDLVLSIVAQYRSGTEEPVKVVPKPVPGNRQSGTPAGSKSGTRGREPVPNPITATAPNGSVAVGSQIQHAGDVLAAVSEAFTAKGIPISTRHRGILGKQARELIDSGFEFDAVVLACVMALRRGEPQNVHFIAGDLVTAKAGQRLTRREYERALQDEMELGR